MISKLLIPFMIFLMMGSCCEDGQNQKLANAASVPPPFLTQIHRELARLISMSLSSSSSSESSPGAHQAADSWRKFRPKMDPSIKFPDPIELVLCLFISSHSQRWPISYPTEFSCNAWFVLAYSNYSTSCSFVFRMVWLRSWQFSDSISTVSNGLL